MRKYKKEILYCLTAPIVIVFIMFLVVCLFETMKIHVPGSREMWIGFIGTVIGGSFTLAGVVVTICAQKDADLETKRLEYMPLLDFEVAEYRLGTDFDLILTVTPDSELITTGFSCLEHKMCSEIVIRSENQKCAFDLSVAGLAVNGKSVGCHSYAFHHVKRRLTGSEKLVWIFDHDTDINLFCLLRIEYRDLFGNRYYQDVPFTYLEVLRDDIGGIGQSLEIRDIKAPVLQTEARPLEEAVGEYMDYAAFC